MIECSEKTFNQQFVIVIMDTNLLKTYSKGKRGLQSKRENEEEKGTRVQEW
jgi:hypothetical protein